MEARYHGWALFFGVCIASVGAYILHLASQRSPQQDRFGVAALGLVALLFGGRFVFAAVTGRIPHWMVVFIDADK